MTPLIGWAILSVVFALLWLRQVRTRNATSVDAAWSTSIAVLVAAYAITATDVDLATRVLVGVMAAVWGLRLAYHLWAHRVRREETEDGRYAAMRETWGDKQQIGFFVTYQVQAGLAVLFSLPAWGALHLAPSPGPLHIVAALVWLISISGESIADNQLSRWRANPDNRGKTCRMGLWRFSRHPNYFFEWLIWWSFALLALPAPGGAWALVAPFVMYLMITRVSGIPYTEAQSLRSRGEDYRDYQRSTSAFFPLPPRPNSQSVRRPAADPPTVSEAPA